MMDLTIQQLMAAVAHSARQRDVVKARRELVMPFGAMDKAATAVAGREWLGLAQLAQSLCDYSVAAVALDRAEARCGIEGDLEGGIAVAVGRGLLAGERGDVLEALGMHRELLDAVRVRPLHSAGCHLNIGEMLRATGNHSGALAEFAFARRAAPDDALALRAAVELGDGLAQLEMGKYGPAEQALDAAAMLAEQSQDPVSIARVRVARAIAWLETARAAQAISVLAEASSVLAEALHLREAARADHNRGIALLEERRFDESVEALDSARSLFTDLGLKRDAAVTTLTMGRAALAGDDPNRALTLLQAAAGDLDPGADPRAVAVCLINESEALMSLGDDQRARTRASEACELLEDGADSRWLAIADLIHGRAQLQGSPSSHVRERILREWIAAILLIDSRRHEFASPAIRRQWQELAAHWRERALALAFELGEGTTVSALIATFTNTGVYDPGHSRVAGDFTADSAPTAPGQSRQDDAQRTTREDFLPLLPPPPLVGPGETEVLRPEWNRVRARYGYSRPHDRSGVALPVQG